MKSSAEKQLPKWYYFLSSSFLGDIRVRPTVRESHQLVALHSAESEGKCVTRPAAEQTLLVCVMAVDMSSAENKFSFASELC